jgi:hypothetical protein
VTDLGGLTDDGLARPIAHIGGSVRYDDSAEQSRCVTCSVERASRRADFFGLRRSACRGGSYRRRQSSLRIVPARRHPS